MSYETADVQSSTSFPLTREIVFSDRFLDALRAALHAWTLSLFDPISGGFRQNDCIGANIMTSTDVVWMRYATNDPELGAPDKDRVLSYLQGSQDPHTGGICHDRGPAGQGHCDAHAFWQTVRALNLLAGCPPRFPAHLEPLLSPDGLRQWFDGIDWDSRTGSNHHEVLGIVPLLVSLKDPAWTDTFFSKLGEQQDPETGAWPRNRVNISRTFAYTVLHIAAGRLPRFPAKIVHTLLRLQRATGFWDEPTPAFHTMDACYILTRLPRLIGMGSPEVEEVLGRLEIRMREWFAEHQTTILDNPHRMLANVHTLGLLQESFPERWPSARPYRFDWEQTAVYQISLSHFPWY